MTKAELCGKLKNDIATVRGYLDNFNFDIKDLDLEEIRRKTVEQSEFVQEKINEFYLGREARIALDIYREAIDLIEKRFYGAEKEQKLKEIKDSKRKMIVEERAKGVPYFLQESYD